MNATLDSLTCPVCLEIFPGNIYQCQNGHGICHLCFEDIELCPICRVKFGNEPQRNLMMEGLLEELRHRKNSSAFSGHTDAIKSANSSDESDEDSSEDCREEDQSEYSGGEGFDQYGEENDADYEDSDGESGGEASARYEDEEDTDCLDDNGEEDRDSDWEEVDTDQDFDCNEVAYEGNNSNEEGTDKENFDGEEEDSDGEEDYHYDGAAYDGSNVNSIDQDSDNRAGHDYYSDGESIDAYQHCEGVGNYDTGRDGQQCNSNSNRVAYFNAGIEQNQIVNVGGRHYPNGYQHNIPGRSQAVGYSDSYQRESSCCCLKAVLKGIGCILLYGLIKMCACCCGKCR